MNRCPICTLIFDVEPIEVGRGKINTDICILCEEHYMNTSYRNTGPRRLCLVCMKSVSTTRGKFDSHTAPGKPHQICAGSGKSVKAQNATLPLETQHQ